MDPKLFEEISKSVATFGPIVALLVSLWAILLSKHDLREVKESREVQQLYQVITSFLDIRESIETVLKLDGKPMEEWTEKDRLAATEVSARFHLAGILVLNRALPEVLFSHAWFYSVPRCYLALRPFLKSIRSERDPRYWSAFDVLASRVEQHAKTFAGFNSQPYA